jgi:transposase InsO family protein
VDILGPLELATERNNKYILVVVDYLTKWSEAYAMPNQTAETVSSKIVDEFVCRFGIPEQLHSDQGRQFESELFTEMCKLLGIKKTRTTPLHPQSD